MQADATVRLALVTIALALVGLLAVGATLLVRPGEGRYELTTYQGRRQGSWLLRLDRETGRVWRIHFPAVRSGWELLPEGTGVDPQVDDPSARDAKREP